MKIILLAILLALIGLDARAQSILRNTFTTNANTALGATSSSTYPIMIDTANGIPGPNGLFFSPSFRMAGTNGFFAGDLSLSGRTNKLSIVNDTLYLDGVAVGGSTSTNYYSTIITTNLTVLNSLTVSNISVTNITVQNNLTVSNLYTVNGNHNTLIVTQAMTLGTLKTNLLAVTATGLVTNANYGSGITWTPSTLTLSASASGGTAAFLLDANQLMQANQTNIDAGTAGTNAFCIIGGSGSGVTNGMLLTNAYALAKLKTPGGAALGAGNHYTIFLLPGIFDIGTNTLTLDTQYIDIVGLSKNTGQRSFVTSWTDKGDTIITSSQDTLKVSAASPNNQMVANVCLETTGASTFAFTLSVDLGADFKMVNVLIRAASAATSKEPMKYTGFSYGGYWEDVRAWYGNCFSGADGAKQLSGTLVRCKAGPFAFGYDTSATLIECEADGCSFGRNTFSGSGIRCRFSNVTGTGCNIFADFGTMSGKLYDCDAGTLGIGTGSGGITGTVVNCVAGSYGTVDVAATFVNGYASATTATLTLGNATLRGLFTATNGIASTVPTAAVTIAATGWTNTFAKNATVYFDGTAVTATVYNNAGTAIYTNAVAITGMGTVNLQPSGKVILSGTGVTGRATVF